MDRGESPIGSGGHTYQWIRSNILGLVAIFIALSGSTVAAQVASDNGAQTAAKKKKKKVVAGPAGPQGPPGPAGPAGPATGAAGGALTGSYPNPGIAPDAVGPGEIKNISRTVYLPLLSFMNKNDVAVLDGVASDGTSPDLTIPGNQVEIEWDDNSTGVADIDSVISNFAVPPDYANSGHYLITASKDADTGVEERFTCGVVLNRFADGGLDSGSASVVDLFAGRNNYFLIPTVTYAPGDSVAVSCHADNGAGGNTANDVVDLEQIQFRYIATQ